MLTNIGLLIDRSGSMTGMEAAVEQGIAEFIDKQKQVEGEAELSLFQFDTQFETLCKRQKLNTCASFRLAPRGGTALYDAVCFSIQEMEKENELRGKISQPDQNILVVITDGGENASVEFNHMQMTELIGKKTDEGWQIIYLSSEPEVINQARDSYYQFSNTIAGTDIIYCAATFAPDVLGMKSALRNLSSNMTCYRSTSEVNFNKKAEEAE